MHYVDSLAKTFFTCCFLVFSWSLTLLISRLLFRLEHTSQMSKIFTMYEYSSTTTLIYQASPTTDIKGIFPCTTNINERKRLSYYILPPKLSQGELDLSLKAEKFIFYWEFCLKIIQRRHSCIALHVPLFYFDLLAVTCW